MHLQDGSIAIAAHTGTLYRIRPRDEVPAIVEEIGAFHPLGSAYTPSLFTTGKESMLAGVALPPRGGHVWLMRQLNHNSSQPVVAFPFRAQDLLLYGSETRDDSGHFYVGGRYTDSNSGAGRPVLLRIEQH